MHFFASLSLEQSIFSDDVLSSYKIIYLDHRIQGLKKSLLGRPGLVDFAWQVILKLAYSIGKGPGK